MTDNYARHTETGELVFFSGSLPAKTRPAKDWAFFALPDGVGPEAFGGRLIGESSDVRCKRLLHAPHDKQCLTCRTMATEEP